jgi:signal transduction histidine kinase
MSAMRGPEEIGRELAEYVAGACEVSAAAVYFLSRPGQSGYRLNGEVGHDDFSPILEAVPALATWLQRVTVPAAPTAEVRPALGVPAEHALLVAVLRWHTAPLGFILLGPPRSGAEHSAEDVEFLAMVADQATPWIAALRAPDVSTATVIHDIKNSVSTLSLLVRNAAGNLSDPEFQRDALATVSRTVDRMRGLLVKLTSSAPEPMVGKEPIDLRALIVEATAPLAASQRVHVVRDLQPVGAVYGDRDALLRVMENLTTNAAEAIDHEGTVTVTLAHQQGHAVISVADTGCGMPQEYLEHHLFAPFSSTKRGGWGVGLYQTKQVVESHCGAILVDSAVGRGTTFTIKLPLRADAETSSLESVR